MKNLFKQVFTRSITKISTLAVLLLFSSFISNAQLKKGSKVFLTFDNTNNEVNVNGDDAKKMLKSYLVGKTSLVLVDSKQAADYVLQLRVIEKNMGNRKGQLSVIDNQTTKTVFESKWVKGTSNAFYGYSGTRHAIGKIVKKQLLDVYPKIEIKN